MITETAIGNTALVFVAVLFVKEFFTFLKWIWGLKNRKNEGNEKARGIIDYERDLNKIDLQLRNHYNSLRDDVTEMKNSMAIMRHDITDIKIAIKK